MMMQFPSLRQLRAGAVATGLSLTTALASCAPPPAASVREVLQEFICMAPRRSFEPDLKFVHEDSYIKRLTTNGEPDLFLLTGPNRVIDNANPQRSHGSVLPLHATNMQSVYPVPTLAEDFIVRTHDPTTLVSAPKDENLVRIGSLGYLQARGVESWESINGKLSQHASINVPKSITSPYQYTPRKAYCDAETGTFRDGVQVFRVLPANQNKAKNLLTGHQYTPPLNLPMHPAVNSSEYHKVIGNAIKNLGKRTSRIIELSELLPVSK